MATVTQEKKQNIKEEDDLFAHRVSLDLTPENARFTPSGGNLISLEVTRPSGEVEFFERIVPVRAFPVTSPDEFISIREPDTQLKGRGAEIGMIRRLSDFPEAVSALISDELSRRYFTPAIKKIHSFSEKFGARNMRRFIEKNIEDNLASLVIDNYETKLSGVSVTVDDGKVKFDTI